MIRPSRAQQRAVEFRRRFRRRRAREVQHARSERIERRATEGQRRHEQEQTRRTA